MGGGDEVGGRCMHYPLVFMGGYHFSKKIEKNSIDFFESLDIHYTVKNIYTKELLDNVIQVDYDKLYKLVKNMINIAPFIEPSDKPKLIKRYKSIIYNQ